jgi:RHS repeat-associated protein
MGGARFTGLAVEIVTPTGRERALIFTDCDLGSPERCDGGGCTTAVRPSPCWERLLAALRTDRPPRKEPCFTGVRAGRDAILVSLADGKRCRVVVLGGDGRPVRAADVRNGAPRLVGSDPGTPPPGLAFTGYVVDTPRGPAAVYSDCPFPPAPDCDEIIVGIDSPPPPPVGDPGAVCEQAVQDGTQQRAWVAVEAAKADFERTFKDFHHNRCFGSALRESFVYQARDREYHFTLRYYDQAGNLVQTVPPQGVEAVAAATATTQVRHRLGTRFRYDSLDRITSQTSPDRGEQRFLYDRADRVRFSQHAQQRADGRWAYVKYDARDRAIETGLLAGVGEAVIRARIDEPAFPAASDGTREDVIQTIHDSAASVPACAPLSPRNLRSRVAAVVALTALGASTLCYSYDEQGRPEAVLRDLPGLGAKRIAYEYDPVTGRLAAVRYQPGQPDALHQRYRYSRAGQLESSESSRDGVLWDRDARFSYYAHGPLARMELGADRVQGVDYTYTLEGRPKGLNTGALTPERDPGHDGLAGGANAAVARDVAGLSVDYFSGDYQPAGLGAGALTGASDPHPVALSPGAGGPTASDFALASCAQATVADGCGLYEGNVVRGVLGLEGLTAARVTGFAYRYDRLYRLTRATSHAGLDAATNRWPVAAPGPTLWRTELSYDGNGNITALSRDAPTAAAPAVPAQMDRLVYRYPLDASGRLTANRLLHVADPVAAAAFPEDLDDQGPFTASAAATHNYAYDASGRLTADRAAGIVAIRWNADNQVSAVEKPGETLAFFYDGLGQRFAKVRQPGADPATWEIEYFVRDEGSSLLATYRRAPAQPPAAPVLEELYLRAGITLGVVRADRPAPAAVAPGTYALVRGDKQYQLASYLGNVLATVSDRRAAVPGAGGAIDHYQALAISSTDYDPFGAVQPGRFLEGDPYRFGFLGFERDDELKGRGASYYAQERLYDPRLGRWLSPDPVEQAARSPYAAFANNPLRFSDPRGTWDKDAILDTLENVAITARDMGRDTARILSGQAAAEAIADNLTKAKTAYDKGQFSEAVAHAIGVQESIEALAAKDLAWQDAGATTEDRIRMGIGEVSGMNDVVRAVTGETEFAEEIPPLERVQLGIAGGVKVVTIAASGAQIGSSALGPKAVAPKSAPKASVKPIDGPGCPLSFSPETPVWTAAGAIPIGLVVAGEEVLTLHPETGQVGEFEVVAPWVTHHEEATRLVLAAPDGRRETILTTPEHHFWEEGAGWIAARDLAPGARLAGAAGWLAVASAESFAHGFEAASLTVADAQTYLVGELGAWVHNCKKFASGKPPHTMEATVKRGGKVVEKRQLTSGNMTPAEKKLGFPKGPLASHTENRATRRIPMKAGDKAVFKGKYEPCPSCKGAMNRKAARTGADIEYRWEDKVWKAKGKKTK